MVNNFNPKKIHTIVTDLDGTLLNKKSQLTELNKNVIQAALNSGIRIIFATGRRFYSSNNFAKQIIGNVQIVCNNGQILRESKDSKRIKTNYINKEEVKRIIKIGKELDLFPLLHVDYFEDGIDVITELPIANKVYGNYLGGDNRRTLEIPNIQDCSYLERVAIVCFLSNTKHQLEIIKSKLQSDTLSCIVTTIPTVGPCVDIISYGNSKWKGILEFNQLNGNSLEGIIAFGDEANDLEMVENSYFGVAMQNAIDEVKSISKFVSKYTNEEDGVGKTLLELGVISL